MSSGRRRILEIAIAAALTACAGVLFLSNAKNPERRSGFDRAVLHIASPLERAVSWLVGGVGDIGNRYFWLRDVDSENRELRAENERLRTELGAVRRVAADTVALEGLLEFTERVTARTLGARVVSGSLSPQYRLIRVRLDRGAGDINAGMPVVTGHGLVGRIETVVGNSAEVLLVTDPRSSVDVVLPKSGGRGVLSGDSRQSRYRARIEQLDRGVAIEIGDPVVTSGLGGAFPVGVALGFVEKVELDASSLYQDVTVAPAVDFSSLDRVLVMLTVPPAPEAHEPVAAAGNETSVAPIATRVEAK